MICIYCKHDEVKVIDSREVEATKSIRRRRECQKCGRRFTTYETVEETPVLVIKNNGTREPFSLNKLKSGIMAACQKRPVSMKDIDNLCIEVEKKIYNTFEDEISSQKIGQFVMDGLQKIDEVSYVRFASVYKKFKDISTFFEFVNEFEKALKE